MSDNKGIVEQIKEGKTVTNNNLTKKNLEEALNTLQTSKVYSKLDTVLFRERNSEVLQKLREKYKSLEDFE